VYAPSEEKSDDSKDSFYEELEQLFDHCPQYHMKILLEISVQKWEERIFSYRQMGMRVNITTVMIMMLD
jgi:transposase